MIVEIFLVLFMQITSTADLSVEQSEPEKIVVMGRKARRWRGTYNNMNGNTTCKTDISSGDPDIDLIGCTSLKICGPRFEPEWINLIREAQKSGQVISREEAVRITRPVMRKVRKCMTDRWKPGLRELRQRRSENP
jgi:hypothetical protein